MKSIAKMLDKGNLRPRDRIITLIKNTIHEEKTGKSFLSDAEKEALSNSWEVKSATEAKEYNKYLFLWRKFEYLKIDITNLINRIQIDYANFEKVLLLYYYRNKEPNHIEKIIKSQYPEHYQKSLQTILENTGIDYDRLVHRLTFISLSKETQEDILSLSYDSRYEPEYLNQEDQLAKILKGKKVLTKDEIKELTDLIIDFLPWEKEKRFKKLHKDYSSIIFNAYFGSYPIIELGKILAEDNDIDYEDEYELRKKLARVHNLKRKLRTIIHKEIKNGLFSKTYIPLCNSEESEIYEIWIDAKNKVRERLQKMIDKKEIVVEEKTEIIFDMKFTKKIIIGTSLYYLDDSINFVGEYKKQAEQLVVYGFLFNLIRQEDFSKKYGYILAFQEIVKKLSVIIGAKATDLDDIYLTKLEELASDTNSFLTGFEDDISGLIYKDLKKDFYIETFFEKFKINLSKSKPVKIIPHKLFDKEAERLLESEWYKLI